MTINNRAVEIAPQNILSYTEHIERQRDQLFPPAKRSVYMSFVRNRSGWHCRFRQNDLPKTPISRKFVLSDEQKIYEAAERGDGLICTESREALDEAVAMGRGGVWLRLTEAQYSALLMPKHQARNKNRRRSPGYEYQCKRSDSSSRINDLASMAVGFERRSVFDLLNRSPQSRPLPDASSARKRTANQAH